MTAKKKRTKAKPVISYPPVSTKTWIPPDQRKKRRIKPPQWRYEKPPGINQPMELSTLVKVWNNFLFVDKGARAILNGTFSLTNRKFRPKSNGNQGNCMCVAALGLTKVHDMTDWSTFTVDKCLDLGDEIYNESIILLETRDPTRTILKMGEITPTFYYGDNKLTMEIREDPGASGKLFPDVDDTPHLKDVIKSYLKKYESGIVETQNRYFAVWYCKKGSSSCDVTIKGVYYLFDPADHNTMGLPWRGVPGTGYSFLGRFNTADKLVEILLENVNKWNNDVFNIYPCHLVRMSRITRCAPKEFEDIVPPPKDKGPEIEEDEVEEKEEKKDAIVDFPSVRLYPMKKLPPPPPTPPRESLIMKELEAKQARKLQEEEYEELNPIILSMMAKRESQIEKANAEGGDAGQVTILDFKPREVPSSQLLKDRPRAASVTYFKTLIDGKMGILRGRTHQKDPNFSKYLGKQSIPNAFSAITMLRIEKSKRWVCKMIKEILELGEHLYHDSKKLLQKEEVLKPSTMIKRYHLRDMEFTHDVDEFSVVGRLSSSKAEVFDLLPALAEFFRDNETGVIVGPLTLAVWIEDGYYYMFDPNERDSNGLAIMRQITIGSQIKIVDVEPGVACCTWYKNLKDLVDVYMNNVAKSQNKDQFYISRVHIKDYILIPDPWCNFQGLGPIKWILRGHISQADKVFPRETRDSQATACATMSLVYTKLQKLCTWTSDTIDEILISGDSLYSSSLDYLKSNNKFYDNKLMVDEIQRRFTVQQRQINLDISDCIVNGVVDAREDDCEVLNLKKGIVEFFKNNEAAVLTSRKISVALWKTAESFYYFDSHGRDERGYISKIGTACVLRITEVEEIVKVISANLGPDIEDALYNLSRVDVQIWEQTEEGDARPPLKNYTEIDKQSAILRATWSFKSPEFTLNAGKQDIPMLLIAIGMLKVYAPSDWNRDVIDEVLILGDKLYETSLEAIQKSPEEITNDEEDSDEITIDNVVKEFKIGYNKFFIDLESALNGNFETFYESFVLFMNANVPDEDQREFVLVSPWITLVGWRDEGVYYVFDPHARDPYGQMYGKDEWSEKPPEPPEYDDEEEEEEEEETENMAGVEGGNLLAEEVEEEEEVENVPAKPLKPKHSSHYWEALSEKNGKACIMQFNNLEKMAQFILDQIPPKQREDIEYNLYPISVKTELIMKNVYDMETNGVPEDFYAGDWYNFKEIEHGRWILKGDMCQTHPMFPCYNQGQQYLSNSLISLAFAYLYAIKMFDKGTINGILRYGDRLLTTSRNIRIRELIGNKEINLSQNQIRNLMSKTKFEMEEIYNKFCIQEHMLFATVEARFIKGDINAQELEELDDVKKGVDKYFEENSYGIVECKDTAVAIWRGMKVFYMFDPASRGPNGLEASPGDACITRYMDTEALVNIFLKNLPKKGSNNFFVHKVEFSKERCCIKVPHPEPPPIPDIPHTAYIKLMPGKWILRGSINQNNPKFVSDPSALTAPAAIIALTMTLLHKSQKWSKPIVDEVLYFADDLYNESIKQLGFDFNPWNQQLSVHLINKDYKIGALQANCELRNTDQRGIIDIKDPKILNLRQGLERFFDENTHGVIQTDSLTLAVWEDEEMENIIYIYDPNPRGPTGLHANDGVACVMCFANKKLAADHFKSNLTESQKRREFIIVPVEIVVGEMRTKPKKKVKKCREPIKTIPCPALKPKPLPICARLQTCADYTKIQLAGATVGNVEKFEQFQATKGFQARSRTTDAKAVVGMAPGTVCPIKKKKKKKKTRLQMELDILGATYQHPTALEKKKIMAMATAEYNFKLGMKLAKLGRTAFYDLPTGDKLLRGMKSQTSKGYSIFSQGNQDIPNCLCYLVLFKLTPVTTWTHKHIDLILDAGDQLYKDSYITYQPRDIKLGLENVMRKFFIRDVEVVLEIYQPTVNGLLIEDNLEAALVSFFYQENFCILTSHDQWVAIYFKKGYYYYFDPHDRDLQGNWVQPGSPHGNACVIRFDDLRNLSRKYISNVILCPSESIKLFTLVLADIKTIRVKSKNH